MRNQYPDRAPSAASATPMLPTSSNRSIAAQLEPGVTNKTTISSASNYARAIITLVVGGPSSPAQEPAPVKFFVHEPFLLDSSPVFRVMLSTLTSGGNSSHNLPAWSEAVSKEICLPEDRVEDWEMMCQWLYSGGSKRNTLTASDFLGTAASALDRIRKAQPGLEDLELESTIADYISWCTARDAWRRCRSWKRKRQAVSKFEIPHPVVSSIDVHEDEAPTQANELSGSKQGLKHSRDKSYSSSDDEPTDTGPPRPKPPAFGRLIRLYILADKYAIDLVPPRPSEPASDLPCALYHKARQYYDNHDPNEGIQQQIILRIRAISKLANVVPDRWDVERLWENILDKGDALRAELVEMYAGLGRRSFERIFGRNLEVADVGSGDGDIGRYRWRPGGYGDDNEEWNSEFLRELVLRKVVSTS